MTGIREWFAQRKEKKPGKDQWLILFLAGILLLIVAMPSGCTQSLTGKETEQERSEETENSAANVNYEAELEHRLEDALSKISGVGRVRVMITFRDSGEAIVEKDVSFSSEEQNTEGEDHTKTSMEQTESTEETVYDTENGDGEPFIRRMKTPAVEGVLVVAECGEQSAAAADISDAIQALFGLEAHKIKIVKMNTAQEGIDENEKNIP